MAPQAVEWVLRLVDRMSAPARAAQQRIQGVERAMQRTERVTRAATAPFRAWASAGESSARRVENAMQRVGNRVSQTSQGLQGLVQGLGMVGFAAAGTGIAAGYAGKKIVDSAAYKQDQLTSLAGMMKGDKLAAAKLFEQAQAFAARTPFTTREILDATRQSVAIGFDPSQALPLVDLAGSLSAGAGKSLDQVMEAFAALRGGDFGQAFGIGQGFSNLNISREMLKKAGLQFDAQGSYKGTVQEGLNAVAKIIRETYGSAMAERSSNISGLASTLASRPEELFMSLVDSRGQSRALKSLQDFMTNLGNLTDFSKSPGSAIQKRFEKSMSKLFTAVFKPLADATEGQRGIELIDRILSKVDEYSAWWEKNGPRIAANIRGFGEGLAAAGRVAETALKPLVWIVETLDRLSGGSGEGGLGKILGFGAGMAAIGWLGNLLSFGMLGKLGGMAGQTLAGAMRTGLTRAWANRGFAQWGLGAFIRSVRGVGLVQALGLGGVGSLFARLTPLVGRFTGFFARLAPLAARFMPWLARIGAAFFGLSNPIGWVVTGVTLIGTLGAALYQKWAPFRDFVDSLADGFRQAAKTAVAWFGSIPDKLRGLGAQLYEAILPQWVRDGLSRIGINLAAPAAQPAAPASTAPPSPLPAGSNASVNALTGVARRIGIDPNALLAVAFKESSLNPAAVNKESGASGLIQFTKTTARGLGTSLEAIRRMSPEQQAPLIERYLRQAGVTAGSSLEQVYAAVFAGSASKTGRVLYTSADGRAYSDNAGLDLNKDGQITSGEAAQAAADAWKGASHTFAPVVNISLSGAVNPQAVSDIGHAAQTGVANALSGYGLELGAGVPGGAL